MQPKHKVQVNFVYSSPINQHTTTDTHPVNNFRKAHTRLQPSERRSQLATGVSGRCWTCPWRSRAVWWPDAVPSHKRSYCRRRAPTSRRHSVAYLAAETGSSRPEGSPPCCEGRDSGRRQVATSTNLGAAPYLTRHLVDISAVDKNYIVCPQFLGEYEYHTKRRVRSQFISFKMMSISPISFQN